MARVGGIYRHPLKGFSPEALEHVVLAPGGHVPGDRVWVLENGRSGFDPAAPRHIPKSRFLVLARHPRLAVLKTRFDEEARRVRIELPEASLELDLSKAAERRRLEGAVTRFLGPEAGLGPVRLLRHERHRFTDDPEGFVSLVNLASVEDLARRMGRFLDPLRFRANFYIEGLAPWVEETWSEGSGLRIGEARFEVLKPIIRCLATHVEPGGGNVEAEVVPALFQHYGHRICGVYLRATGTGLAARGDLAEHGT